MSAAKGKQRSNVSLLTEGERYFQRAKKARQDQIDEIKFDDSARREYLTGFSKRKKAKTEEKRARAKERDRLAHLEERKKARQELRERAAENVKNMRIAMGLEEIGGDPDEGDGVAGPSSPARAAEEEEHYSDEEQAATVTITDAFDPSASNLVAPLADSDDEATLPTVAAPPTRLPEMPASSKRAQQKEKRLREEAKVRKEDEKKKSRSMETKGERKKGREYEAKRRAKRAGIAMERDGRSRGIKARDKGSRGKGKLKGKRK